MPGDNSLPTFIKPMLAKPGEPFDSEKYFFEIKWDGTRAVLFVDGDGYRFMNRRRRDITARYPEFAFLSRIPAGTVLDGEIVVLDEHGKPSFDRLQSREQARTPLKYRTLSAANPATYVVFDQLYAAYQPIIDDPWQRRRDQLIKTAPSVDGHPLVVSDGVIGTGKAFFEQVCAQQLEGVVAKRMDSRYFPGRRTDAWIKFKKTRHAICAVIGYVPDGQDFESLIIAAKDETDQLRCVGKVGTGFNGRSRPAVIQLLHDRAAESPVIQNSEKGKWIDPVFFCEVRYFERTKNGNLRAPVFVRLVHHHS